MHPEVRSALIRAAVLATVGIGTLAWIIHTFIEVGRTNDLIWLIPTLMMVCLVGTLLGIWGALTRGKRDMKDWINKHTVHLYFVMLGVILVIVVVAVIS